MRPSRKQLWDRTMAGMSVGVLTAAGVLWASDARADTTLAAEGTSQLPAEDSDGGDQ